MGRVVSTVGIGVRDDATRILSRAEVFVFSFRLGLHANLVYYCLYGFCYQDLSTSYVRTNTGGPAFLASKLQG
jgi:hypothetical protein